MSEVPLYRGISPIRTGDFFVAYVTYLYTLPYAFVGTFHIRFRCPATAGSNQSVKVLNWPLTITGVWGLGAEKNPRFLKSGPPNLDV